VETGEKGAADHGDRTEKREYLDKGEILRNLIDNLRYGIVIGKPRQSVEKISQEGDAIKALYSPLASAMHLKKKNDIQI